MYSMSFLDTLWLQANNSIWWIGCNFFCRDVYIVLFAVRYDKVVLSSEFNVVVGGYLKYRYYVLIQPSIAPLVHQHNRYTTNLFKQNIYTIRIIAHNNIKFRQ